MKQILFSITVFVLLTGCFPNEETTNANNEAQWEYLIVSFGKTIFETPQKMFAYESLGIEDGSESVSLQSKFDILGRFGWELVNVIGQIGGDQQYVFRRKYDKDRSTSEYEMIKNGKETYLQDIIEQSKGLQAEQEKLLEEYKNKPKLTDLDEVERGRKREELRSKLEDAYITRWKALKDIEYSTFSLSFENHLNDIEISIKVDLTEKYLLDGKKYHGDKIASYLKSLGKRYRFKHSLLKRDIGIRIVINGFVMFEGEEIVVDIYSTNYLSSIGSWF